jgi:hypothetical protein
MSMFDRCIKNEMAEAMRKYLKEIREDEERSGNCLVTSRTYPWSFVTQIKINFRKYIFFTTHSCVQPPFCFSNISQTVWYVHDQTVWSVNYRFVSYKQFNKQSLITLEATMIWFVNQKMLSMYDFSNPSLYLLSMLCLKNSFKIVQLISCTMFDKKKDCNEKVNNLFVVMAKIKVNNFRIYY